LMFWVSSLVTIETGNNSCHKIYAHTTDNDAVG